MFRALFSFLFAAVFTAAWSISVSASEPDKLEFKYENGRLKIGEARTDGSFDRTIYDQSPGALTNPKHLTSDINSPGWVTGKDGVGVQQIWWRAVQTDCQPCRGLVANFNSVMDQLLLVRYQRKEAKFSQEAFTKKMRAQMKSAKLPSDPKAAEEESASRLGTLVDVGDRFKQIDAHLAAQEKLLTAQAQELRRAIADCEKQCQGKVTKTSGIKPGGLPALGGAGSPPKNGTSSLPALPIPWKGPYPAVCTKCANLAEHLNKLAGWARQLQQAKAAAERELKLADMQWKLVRASYHYGYVYPPASILQSRNGAKADLEKIEEYRKILLRNFNQTLAAYEKCIKTCKPGEKQAALIAPGTTLPETKTAEPKNTSQATTATEPVSTDAPAKPAATPATPSANESASENPDYKGWYTRSGRQLPSTWVDFYTECLQCKPLAQAYNQVMRQLYRARYQLAFLTQQRDAIRKHMASIRSRSATSQGQSSKGKQLSGSEAELAASQLDYQAGIMDLNDNLGPQLRKLISSLEVQAATLRAKIKACEKECEAEIASESRLVDGQAISLPLLQPPFTWKGPYPDVCPKCAKLAARLNALPRLAHQTMAELAAAQARKQLAETELQMHRTLDQAVGTGQRPYARPIDPATANEIDLDRATRKNRITYLQGEVKAAEREIKRHEGNLAKLKANFNQTLALYNDCIKTCKTKTACYEPERNYENISIGPNETYGSGAQIKETASSIFGGGSPGLGNLGGGGTFGGKPKGTGTFSERATQGSGGKEPETVDDPTSGPFFRSRAGDVNMRLRGNFIDDGLLISTKLDDVPGDGTFHAMWLEDSEGRVVQPNRYLMFSLWREWRLTVWWTYDRWVDGQHVEHREGGWTESWREERDGLMALYGGEDGVKNSIWNSLGFGTPVRGVQHLGAVFPITAADLTGPCPLRLVTHVALPEEDPVITQPFVNDLSISADTAGSNPDDDIIVNIRQTFRF